MWAKPFPLLLQLLLISLCVVETIVYTEGVIKERITQGIVCQETRGNVTYTKVSVYGYRDSYN